MAILSTAQLILEVRLCGVFLLGCFEKSLESKVFVSVSFVFASYEAGKNVRPFEFRRFALLSFC